ncbi:Histone deacetylase complex subunit [Basidiobolus ranarum]
MIQCELCKVWQHCACVDILDEKDCPEQYFCEQCMPENHPYLQYYKSNIKANSSLKPRKYIVEGGSGAQSDGKSSDESKKKKRVDQIGDFEVENVSDFSDHDPIGDSKKENRSKRTKNSRNRSLSPISSGRKAKDSESDEEYLSRGERKKKKANPIIKPEDHESPHLGSKNKKRDSKNSDPGDDEPFSKGQEESHTRKLNKRDGKENEKEHSSSHESEIPPKLSTSNEDAHTNARRKKPRKASPDHARSSSRSKDGAGYTPDNRRSPPVRIKNVSNRMSFHDMNRRTKHIFDCITRIQVSMAEKEKEEGPVVSAVNGNRDETTTMEMVEGLTRKLVQFQELYGDMR